MKPKPQVEKANKEKCPRQFFNIQKPKLTPNLKPSSVNYYTKKIEIRNQDTRLK